MGFVLLAVLCSGCRHDMFDQPKYEDLEMSRFFADGRAARPIPAGTFTYDSTDAGEAVERGTTGGEFVASIPIAVDEQLLLRGRERFDIFCSPCHGRLGDGQGMIARRGFKQPSDLQGDRVRNAPPGYIFAVITNGYGAMADYAGRVPVRDRWAIVAYIRALELSRRATLDEVAPEGRTELENTQ